MWSPQRRDLSTSVTTDPPAFQNKAWRMVGIRGRRTKDPRGIQAPIPGTCEHSYMMKGDRTDVTEGETLRWGDFPGLS